MSPAALEDYLTGCRIDPATGRPLGRRSGKPIKAIVPVHLYGQMADMSPILNLAARYGLLIVEDACQAHGAECLIDGVWRRAGSVGAAAAFSFYPGKNLGACGEAGAVTTGDAEIAARVRMLRDHGQVRKYQHDLEGYNARLDAIQAGFLRIKLRRLHAWNDERRARAACYHDLLATLPGIVTPVEARSSRAVYHLYIIRTSLGRDQLAAHLNANGIATGLHYPIPAHRQRCYRDWDYPSGSLPATDAASAEIVSLPMFPGLTGDQQARVAAAIDDYVRTAAVV
jgi:dTDP-4-amino-4,6-dideoxygalactose transaminase